MTKKRLHIAMTKKILHIVLFLVGVIMIWLGGFFFGVSRERNEKRERIKSCEYLSEIYKNALDTCRNKDPVLGSLEEPKSCMKACGMVDEFHSFDFIRVDKNGYVICSKEKK